MKQHVLHPDQMPSDYPKWTSLLLVLCLDHWKAPDWLWITVIGFILLVWAAVYMLRLVEEPVEIQLDPEKLKANEERLYKMEFRQYEMGIEIQALKHRMSHTVTLEPFLEVKSDPPPPGHV